jgi:hypothetical protein
MIHTLHYAFSFKKFKVVKPVCLIELFYYYRFLVEKNS